MQIALATRVFKALFLALLSLYLAPAFADSYQAIVGGAIIDGVGNSPLRQNVILVRNDRIHAIGSRDIIPAGAEIIDLGSATLLPGMIDCHVHLTLHEYDYQTAHLRTSSAYKALLALKAVQAQLQAGWTTVRDLGAADIYYSTMDLKRAIDEGLFVGPRITGAAHYLSITGGGGDVNYYSPEQPILAEGLIVNGTDEVRKAVRTEAKYGSEWIKLLVSGAFMSVGDDPRNVHFTEEELLAAVSEATKLGRPVAAHAHATEAIKMAVQAGARSIEHGSYLDREAIRLMKKHGTFLVPTLYIGDYYNDPRNTLREQAVNDEYIKNYRQTFFDLIGEAHRAGIPIATGSDMGGNQYDPRVYVRELATLVEAGMSPMEAIQAATRVGAELLQWDDRLGTIEPGKLADIIAVSGNPLEDIGELERVGFVMIGGKAVRNTIAQ